MDTETLLKQIHDYCDRAGIKPSTFGKRAAKDGKLVARLEQGGQCLPRTTAKIIKFINDPPQENGASS